jgi:predicted RNase H-like HicB family nuclease
MLSYPARLIPGSEGRVMLVLPDVPELVLVAASEAEAFGKAPGLLDTILEGYEQEGKPLPRPSDICGAPAVESRRFAAFASIQSAGS